MQYTLLLLQDVTKPCKCVTDTNCKTIPGKFSLGARGCQLPALIALFTSGWPVAMTAQKVGKAHRKKRSPNSGPSLIGNVAFTIMLAGVGRLGALTQHSQEGRTRHAVCRACCDHQETTPSQRRGPCPQTSLPAPACRSQNVLPRACFCGHRAHILVGNEHDFWRS